MNAKKSVSLAPPFPLAGPQLLTPFSLDFALSSVCYWKYRADLGHGSSLARSRNELPKAHHASRMEALYSPPAQLSLLLHFVIETRDFQPSPTSSEVS